MGLFVDNDGAAYHIYSSRENYDLRIVRLSEDYLFVASCWQKECVYIYSRSLESKRFKR